VGGWDLHRSKGRGYYLLVEGIAVFSGRPGPQEGGGAEKIIRKGSLVLRDSLPLVVRGRRNHGDPDWGKEGKPWMVVFHPTKRISRKEKNVSQKQK